MLDFWCFFEAFFYQFFWILGGRRLHLRPHFATFWEAPGSPKCLQNIAPAMLLELYPFQTELFCIARPRVRSEARFVGRFLRFWCVLGGPVEAFWVQIVVKKVFRKKSAKLSENGSRG